jgi:hypothetical protein
MCGTTANKPVWHGPASLCQPVVTGTCNTHIQLHAPHICADLDAATTADIPVHTPQTTCLPLHPNSTPAPIASQTLPCIPHNTHPQHQSVQHNRNPQCTGAYGHDCCAGLRNCHLDISHAAGAAAAACIGGVATTEVKLYTDTSQCHTSSSSSCPPAALHLCNQCLPVLVLHTQHTQPYAGLCGECLKPPMVMHRRQG